MDETSPVPLSQCGRARIKVTVRGLGLRLFSFRCFNWKCFKRERERIGSFKFDFWFLEPTPHSLFVANMGNQPNPFAYTVFKAMPQ